MRWEYKATVLEFGDTDMLQAQLNALGAEGWELVYFRDEEKAGKLWAADCIFKRECVLECVPLDFYTRGTANR